jgi:hypothetical protein
VITEEMEPLKVFERRMGVDVDSVLWSLSRMVVGDISDVLEVHSASTFDPEDGGNITYSYIAQQPKMMSPSSGWKTEAVCTYDTPATSPTNNPRRE